LQEILGLQKNHLTNDLSKTLPMESPIDEDVVTDPYLDDCLQNQNGDDEL